MSKFLKNNCERIVEVLQKILYNIRPLGPLLPRQYYSTRSSSSSHKFLAVGAVKVALTDFCCKILFWSRINDMSTKKYIFSSIGRHIFIPRWIGNFSEAEC
jgi:hypothetical protein